MARLEDRRVGNFGLHVRITFRPGGCRVLVRDGTLPPNLNQETTPMSMKISSITLAAHTAVLDSGSLVLEQEGRRFSLRVTLLGHSLDVPLRDHKHAETFFSDLADAVQALRSTVAAKPGIMPGALLLTTPKKRRKFRYDRADLAVVECAAAAMAGTFTSADLARTTGFGARYVGHLLASLRWPHNPGRNGSVWVPRQDAGAAK